MNKDLIHNAIEHPEVALNAGVEDLEKISSQYPYFGAAQLLLTKAYQRTNNYRYTDQLHQAAIYSTDRKHLYDWVKKPLTEEATAVVSKTEVVNVAPPVLVKEEQTVVLPQPEPTPQVETVAKQSPEVVPALPPKVSDLVSMMLEDELPTHRATQEQIAKPTVQPIIEKVEVVQTAEVTTQDAPVVTEPTQLPTESEANVVHETPPAIEDEVFHIETVPAVEEEQAVAEKQEAPVISLQQFDPVEQEILLEAMQSSIELEVSEELEEIEPVVRDSQASTQIEAPIVKTFNAPVEEEDSDSYATWVFKRSQQVHFSDADKPAMPQEEPQAVNDWVRAPRPESIEDNEEEEELTAEETTPTIAEEPDELPVEEKTYPSHGIQKLTPSIPKSHQQDLIDRFIKFEPKITPGKALEYTTGNFAKESLEEDFSFMTETMAILFAQQGKPDKARKAFKKLMELHPEKSVYFAAQLKNLDKYKK